ncbi:MAG: gliding motility-associated C-terminal domain-containing protein [Salibacteraceae bacterium]
MKKLLLPLFLIACLSFVASPLLASHNQGMNITYRHINGDTFEVIIDFMRYCGGTAFSPSGQPQSAAGLPNSVNATLFCSDQGFSTNINLAMDTTIEASPICAAQSYLSTCPPNGNYQTGLLGIQWAIYKGTFSFSQLGQSTCSEWMMYTSICCRNNGTNFVGSPSLLAYAKLNQADFPTNSAVQFTTPKPVPFFCDGQEVTYNWGAVELDGDSLYWELDTAIAGFNATTGFTYIPYNATIPATGLEPIPGITIDDETGQVQFTAYIPPGYNLANYAVAVRVDEYNANTGAYKGSVHRDVQFIVLDSCDNNPPVDQQGIQNFSGSGALLDSNTIEVCFGQDFEFDLLIYDYDSAGNLSNDSMTITCNIGQLLPGATYTTTGTNPDTVHISWTAVPTNLTLVPFNLTVEDDNCPVTGFNIYNYKIRIVPSTFLGPDTAICSLDTIQLNANGGDTFSWSVLYGDPIQIGTNFGCVQCKDPWIHPSVTTAYVVESNLSATCGNKDTIVVEVFNEFPVDLTPSHGGTVDTVVYCSTDPLDTFNALTPGGTFLGPGIVNTVDGVFAPDLLDPGFGKDSSVIITYVLEGICANTFELPVRVKGQPDARVLTQGPFCKLSTEEQLEGYTAGGTWNGPNTTTTGLFDPSAYANTAPDTVMIYHTVDDSGCVFTDSAQFRIINEYNSAIDSLPKICAGEELELLLNQYEGDPFGVWSGKNVTEDENNPGDFYFSTEGIKAGTYEITYTIEGECGTSTTDELVISLLPDASIFGADSVYCDNIVDSVQLETAREEGNWGGSLVELHDGYFVPNRVGEGVYTITYELYDTVTTCYNKEEVEVRIARTPVSPKLHGGGPYCQGDNWTVRGDGLLSNTYKWYSWDGTYMNEDSVLTLADMELLGAGNPFFFGELVDMPTAIYGTQVSEYGCESAYSRLETIVKPSPEAFFVVDSTASDVARGLDGTMSGNVPLEVTFINLSGPDSSQLSYTWTFGNYENYTEIEGDPQTFTFEEIGTFTVELVADNGQCTDSHLLLIRADRVTNFFIPNVFTPNGDNNNDLFEWEIEGIDNFQMVVYNRWGKKVFETTEIDDYWDGTRMNGGSECDPGTYFYVITGQEQTLDAENVEWRGDLTLIREE